MRKYSAFKSRFLSARVLAACLVMLLGSPCPADDLDTGPPMQLADEQAGWRVRYGADGRMVALQMRFDGRWQRIDFHPHPVETELRFEWKHPVTVSHVVYYGRTAWDENECFKDYEIYAENNTKPLFKGRLQNRHGPQTISLPVRVPARCLRIAFTSSYAAWVPDGGNPGASEIQMFSITRPKENLAERARISASSEYGPEYKARNVADGEIPEAGSRDDAARAWCVRGDRNLDGRQYAGPQWYGEWGGQKHFVAVQPADGSTTRFEGRSEDLLFWLEYASIDGRLAIVAGIRNTGENAFEPVKAGLKLGLDTRVAAWPNRNRKLFPTLLRCEKTHFWGYAMSPRGHVLAIASPDPIASWSLDYDPQRRRVNTLNIDLMNAGPLPPRHPSGGKTLGPGEERQWTVFLVGVDGLQQLKPVLADVCAAPMFEIQRHTVEKGEPVRLVVYCGEDLAVNVIPRSGRLRRLPPVSRLGGRYGFRYTLDEWPGVYRLVAQSESGKRAEAAVCMRRPWSWYLQQARKEALRCAQKPSTHAESWHGLFSMFLARRHFPDAELDARSESVFREIFPLVYDSRKLVPLTAPNHIRNAAAMCGLLVDRYQCTGEPEDLETAAGLAEFLTRHQGPDGGFYNGKKHCTSVIYLAKSIMELMEEEKKLASEDELWAGRYGRHYESVRAAVDDLARRRDNLATEGEASFADDTIGCGAAQLAMFALLQEDTRLRRKYTEAAVYLMQAHRCLDQLAVPDCRTRGATLRFWDSPYDVLMRPNVISSPHGWSAWRIYALWYLYQLTGEEAWLRQAQNALGSCVQLIDSDTATLRWGFVVDPYVRADAFARDAKHPGRGVRKQRVIGEKYVGMISDWWKAPPGQATGGYWGQGGCCDNAVHEIFKCLEETALTSAYVVQRGDGTLAGYNCRVESRGGRLIVEPSEPIVSAVHVNLQAEWDVAISFPGEPARFDGVSGMQWLRKQTLRSGRGKMEN